MGREKEGKGGPGKAGGEGQLRQKILVRGTNKTHPACASHSTMRSLFKQTVHVVSQVKISGHSLAVR